MKSFPSRKGQFGMTVNQGNLIYRLIFMLFVALSIVMLVKSYIAVSIDTTSAESSIMINRIMYSPDCISANSPMGRSEPGIIDAARLTESHLDSCLNFGEQNDYAAANLTLTYLDNNETKQAYYNSAGYILLKPRAGIGGPGGAKGTTAKRYVLVQDKGTYRQAMLSIDFVIPNN